MGIVYDVGLSFVFLSESIIQYPNLRSDFEELYKTDKYRFYERARHHRYYDHINMVDNTLEAEVAMRRVFGILLCAEDDEFIRRFVQIKLMGTDARYEKIIENPNKKDITRFWEQNQRVKAESYAQRNSPFWFLAYLLYSSFGINNNETVDWYLAMNQEDLSEMNRYSLEGYISNYRNFDDDFIVTLRGVRNIIRRLNAGLDICSFTDFLENSLLRVNSVNANPELYRFIEDYYKSGKDEAQDIDSAIFTELLAPHRAAAG